MTDTALLSPTRLGEIDLQNKVVMAPMTRLRAPGGLPNALMAEYYTQRASAGLIVTECTMISDTSAAYLGAPGIYADSFIDGWQRVTDVVHALGGKIFLQLWHSGRIAHTSLMPGHILPLAPSAVRGEGELYTHQGKQRVSKPKSMSLDEIFGLTKAFGKAARRAGEAGFDGVEIHGAFGYLIDQFLQDASNVRTDEYGGTFANRFRFLSGIIDSVKSSYAGPVAVKLSPSNRFHGMSDSDPEGLFSHVLTQLDGMGLAYVHMMEAQPQDIVTGRTITDVAAFARRHYSGTIVANGGFNAGSAESVLQRGDADLVSFGQLYIANPDLPERFRQGAELAMPNFEYVYGGQIGRAHV